MRSKKLGRKYIKGFASGIAQQFATSADHYAWVACHHQIPSVTIDLLQLNIEPSVFNSERNRNLASRCQQTLFHNVRQLAVPAAVVSAVLEAYFGIDDYVINDNWPAIGESLFVVTLIDDRGKRWRVKHVEKSVLLGA